MNALILCRRSGQMTRRVTKRVLATRMQWSYKVPLFLSVILTSYYVRSSVITMFFHVYHTHWNLV